MHRNALDGTTTSSLATRVGDTGGDPTVALAEAVLRAENDVLRLRAERAEWLLASAADHAVVSMNLGGRITGWSAGASAILGYVEAEVLGRSGEMLLPVEDRGGDAFVGALCRAMEHGRTDNERWHLRRDGSRVWASGTILPLLNDEERTVGFLSVFRDDTARRAAEERRSLLLAEAEHRIKNTLATGQVVVLQTLRRAGVDKEVCDLLAARLAALARSHELLAFGAEGAPLIAVVERALAPYGGAERVAWSGPPVCLPAHAVEMLGLAFHELATNAAKHGALSVPEGGVELRWSLRRAGNGARLMDLTWREYGGPPVVAPTPEGRGFGSRLLERGVMQDLGGTVHLDFHPEGLACRVCLPVGPGSGTQ